MSDSKKHSNGPPIPKLEDSYALFKKEVSLWAITTTVEEKRQAGTIIFCLPPKAKAEALEIPVSELQDGKTVTIDGHEKKLSGIECLLEVLDKIYLEDIAKEKFKCYDKFRKMLRPDDQSIKDFTLDFEKAVKRLEEHEIKLPSAVLAYELLRSANVSEYQYSVAVAIVGELNYDNMKNTVRKITELPSPQKSSAKTQMKIVKEENSYFMDNESEFSSYENKENEEVYYNQNNRGRSRYRQPRRGFRSYNYGGRGNYQRNPEENGKRVGKKTNPRDSNGHIMPCSVCKSIFHFANQCPDSSPTYYNENVALLQNNPVVQQNLSTMDQFTRENFGLAVLDSGCNTTVCGQQWLDAYLSSLPEADLAKVTHKKSEMQFKFGDNPPSKSDVIYNFPGEICGKKVTIVAQVVTDQIPLLISKQTMKKASMIIDFTNDTVEAFGQKQKLIFTNSGHCSIPLSTKSAYNEVCACAVNNIVLLNDCISTDKVSILNNIPKIHKQYCHPSADALKSLIRTAGKLTPEIGSEIDKVTKSCEICVRYKQPPRKPVVCMPLAKDFNETVAMDLKVFDQNKGIYLQHQIDHRTRFSTVKVIRSKDKETVVSSVFTHWINIFGPPKKFMTDNGGEYVNSSFMDLCEKLNVHVVTTGAEAPWSNGLVERHHALLSSSIRKIQEDTNCSIEVAAAWAVHAKNSLSNIDGFSPYQLLFGKNPLLNSLEDPYTSPTTLEDETPSETVARNITAIYSARRQQMEQETNSKIKRAIKAQTRDVYSEKINSNDLVYYKRNDCKRWRGPGTVIGTEGKLVFVRHGGYVVRCHRVHVIRVNEMYVKNESDTSRNDPPAPTSEILGSKENRSAFETAQSMMTDDVVDTNEPDQRLSEVSSAPPTLELLDHETPDTLEPTISSELSQHHDTSDPSITRKEQQLCETKSKIENKRLEVPLIKKDPFYSEKLNEINKWRKNGVFEEVSIDQMEEDERPVTTRWVKSDEGGKKKARLVARGFEEAPLSSTDTVSPTCRKESLRLLFSITASKDWPLRALDIASAFLQGKPIERTVYVLPPKEFYKHGFVWKLKKCVYGLSDAAKMWYSNVRDQTAKAGLTKSLYDDALFFSSVTGVLSGLMTVHVDDFVYSGCETFEENVREHILDGFEVKSEETTSFNYLGLEVSQNLQSHEITVQQDKYVKELKSISISKSRKVQKASPLNSSEYSQFRTGIGQLLWLSVQTRPDISFTACQLSNNLKEPNIADLNLFNKTVKQLQSEDPVPLVFSKIPNLEMGMKLLTYSDASYGNLSNNGSQCGYLIFLADMNEEVKNLITWRSVRLDRVCNSTLAAESLALLKAVDHSMFIQQTLKQMIGEDTDVRIQCYIDNKGLLELINKTKDPLEKRLIVTMASLRESVEKEEIVVNYIASKMMPADVLTKKNANKLVLKSYLDGD